MRCDSARNIGVLVNEWQMQRGYLNHNWLQNGVLVALNHARVVVSDKVRAKNARQTMEDDISRWPERREDLVRLLRRFEEEMSPKVYFSFPPLSRCTNDIKRWLIPFTHERWLVRENVKDKIKTALAAHKSAERAFKVTRITLNKLPEPATLASLQRVDSSLKDFISACETLSEAISVLPNRITCC